MVSAIIIVTDNCHVVFFGDNTVNCKIVRHKVFVRYLIAILSVYYYLIINTRMIVVE